MPYVHIVEAAKYAETYLNKEAAEMKKVKS